MSDELVTARWQAIESQRKEQLDQSALMFRRLVCLLADLHDKNGCPWDREQSLASLRQYIREEADEVCQAIDNILEHENELRRSAGTGLDQPAPPQTDDPSRTATKGLSIAHHPHNQDYNPHLSASGAALPELDAGQQAALDKLYGKLFDEMGDLLLQPVFLSEILWRMQRGGIERSAEAIVSKLIRRHPHIYGELEASNATDVLNNWESIKQAERLETDKS